MWPRTSSHNELGIAQWCKTLLAVACLLLSTSAFAQTTFESRGQTLTVDVVTRGLDHPWSLEFLPTGEMLVSERPGRLRRVNADGRLDPVSIGPLPADLVASGQGGLMGLALHPNFSNNAWLYFAYAGRSDSGIGTVLARARLQGNRLEQTEELFRAQPGASGGRHFGGRVLFDRSGYVYLTLGDRGDRDSAQDLNKHAGSMIRLNADGSVPGDNPFVGRAGARPEIFSYGHRNIQGAVLHPQTGALWTHEHGPQGGDEVNVVRAGENYGWPVITYGANYFFGTSIGEGTEKPGMAQPLHYWVPSIAPSGMSFVVGDRYPQWRGDLLVGSLKFAQLTRLQLEGERVVDEERLMDGTIGRIRDVRQGPDGLIYLLSDAPDGVIARLLPTPP